MRKRAAIDIDDAQLRRMAITNPPDEAVEIAFLKARLNPWIVIVCGPGHPPKDILNCPGNRDFDKVVRLSRRTYQHHLTTKAQKKEFRNRLVARFQFVVWNDPTRSYIPFYKETEQKTRADLRDKASKVLAKSYTPDPNVTERLYATTNAIKQLFRGLPDPNYDDNVVVVAVVPAPAPTPAPLPEAIAPSAAAALPPPPAISTSGHLLLRGSQELKKVNKMDPIVARLHENIKAELR